MYLMLGVDGLRALENYNPSTNVSICIVVLLYSCTNYPLDMGSSS